MKLSRPSRLIAACVMLFSMFFMQLAVAAYACPEWTPLHAQTGSAPLANDYGMHDLRMSAEGNAAAMSDCAGLDPDQPNLCHAYDYSGHQSLDKPNVPAVSPFMPAALVVALGFVEDSQHILPDMPSQALTRTTAPPLSIQLCCFRI